LNLAAARPRVDAPMPVILLVDGGASMIQDPDLSDGD
jgi:hypothetical protein